MLKGLDLIVRIATCCAAVMSFAACGGDDEKSLAGYSEQCASDDDCEIDLLCVGAPLGLCTVECTNNAPCLTKSPTGICTELHCYDACTAETQSCPNPELKCTMNGMDQGTCRVPR